MSDDLRPRGTVEVECERCGWSFWLDPLDVQLSLVEPHINPILCARCSGHETGEKAGELHGRPAAFNPRKN